LINIIIPNEVEIALSILNESGYEAYIVGGCVRDSLLGNAPNDWDITTSAKPDEIISCFNGYRTINTGLRHGTVTIIIIKKPIEITTYRIDGKYSDNRRPDNVCFTDNVTYDLKRRDFTINSLAYNKKGIIDLFGGIDDIRNKVIKCVGDPDERFNEDGLRILRALRFASVLNFKIDNKTSVSIHKNKELLNNISKERITVEFNKLLKGVDFLYILKQYKDVIEIIIPDIAHYNIENWEVVLNSMNQVEDLRLRLSILLHKTNAEKVLRNLKYDGETIKNVNNLVSFKDEEILPNKIKIKKQLSLMEYENYKSLIEFKKALYKPLENKFNQQLIDIEKTEKILNEIVMNKECYNLKMLEIDGKDLKREGYFKGVLIGSVLNEILNLVIEERIENKKEVLIDYARKYKNT
jgi:tRNA nucleotidyltransferase (CCA-adding enzyme)